MEQLPNTEVPIAVAGLCKSFGAQTVLDGITFQLVAGQVTCVLGRSGTGKSVLLKMLIGLEPAGAGSIRLEGCDISSASLHELNEARKKVGFLFQQAALYDSMTIGDNVAFPLRRQLRPHRHRRRWRPARPGCDQLRVFLWTRRGAAPAHGQEGPVSSGARSQ